MTESRDQEEERKPCGFIRPEIRIVISVHYSLPFQSYYFRTKQVRSQPRMKG
jgi:hypothetical protein